MHDPLRRPRLSIEINEEQEAVLQKLDWGIRSAIFRKIVDSLIDVLQSKDGPAFIGAILVGKMGVKDFVKLDKKGKKR